MGFCTRCGTEIGDGGRFCRSCGQPVANPQAQTDIGPSSEGSPPQPPAVAAAVGGSRSIGGTQLMLIIGVVAAIVLVGVIALARSGSGGFYGSEFKRFLEDEGSSSWSSVVSVEWDEELVFLGKEYNQVGFIVENSDGTDDRCIADVSTDSSGRWILDYLECGY